MNWSTWDRCPPGNALSAADPEIARLIEMETRRQNEGLELIASENFVSPAVLEAMGSPLTNKYAEGLPGKRYYGGCEVVDQVEQIAIDRAKQLFGAEHANVQPHSGASANAAVFLAFLKPGDVFLGMDLSNGGHLTHGSSVNFSGLIYKATSYGVTDDGLLDYEDMERKAREHRPKMIIAGYSAYSRAVDFARFAAVAKEVGALFLVDMAHFAGLAAAGVYPSPVPHADVVTTTTHKTLRGPRGGLILCRAEHAKAVDKAMFPGTQGGPLEHVIAAKAVAFGLAATPGFRERQERTLAGARILAERLLEEPGIGVVSGGTDVHLVLVDLRASDLDGKQAEDRLHRVGITVNRNAVPFDPRPPMVSSGVRIGTPALATRGFDAEDFRVVADVIARALRPSVTDAELPALLAALADRVAALADRHPLYPELQA